MINTIYKIQNSINEKVYIGQTWGLLTERFAAHKRINNKDCIKFHNALNKYGRENFIIETITFSFTQHTANILEIYFIKKFNSIKNGYNIALGGNSVMLGRKHSQKTRNKMSKSSKGKLKSEQHKEKISKSHIGKIFSIEHKENLSKSRKGIIPTRETRLKMSKSRLGNKNCVGRVPWNKGKTLSKKINKEEA